MYDQKISKTKKMFKLNNLREYVNKIPLSHFCVGLLLLSMELTLIKCG